MCLHVACLGVCTACAFPCTMIASVPGPALHTIQKFVYFITCITRGGSILCVYMEVIIIK